jgi:hypothetical protein
MNSKWCLNKVKPYGVMNNIKYFSFFGKKEVEKPVDIADQNSKNPNKMEKDKPENKNLNSQQEPPIKEDKICEYYRDKIKKYDGRLN